MAAAQASTRKTRNSNPILSPLRGESDLSRHRGGMTGRHLAQHPVVGRAQSPGERRRRRPAQPCRDQRVVTVAAAKTFRRIWLVAAELHEAANLVDHYEPRQYARPG